jgi:alkylhydroperoxidase family enzyme
MPFGTTLFPESAAVTCEGIERPTSNRYEHGAAPRWLRNPDVGSTASDAPRMITMHSYRIHTIESAPEASRKSLQGLQQYVGRVPNLAATMAESPTLVNGFVGALVNFSGGTFSNAQRQAILLTNAVVNRSAWAVAFHSTAGLKEGIDPDDVRAIREGRLPQERKLAALSTLARTLTEKRGHLEEHDLRAFSEAGFGPDQVLEVIAGVATSLMANYAGNITHPTVEDPFQAQRWTPPNG